MRSKSYEPQKCPHCNQFVDYSLTLSKGHAISLIKIYNYIKGKDLNAVHLSKELLALKIITADEKGNVPQLRHWGLISQLEESGNYAITAKAIDFLKSGLVVPKKVIVNKGMGEEDFGGFFEPEITTSFKDLLKKENVYWEGEYIRHGEIINSENGQ